MGDRTPRDLLVVAAHPDDETLGCGGLIARTTREGGNVSILILTDGSTAQYPNQPHLVEAKEDQARQAARALGTEHIEFAGLPDMALSTLKPSRLNSPVEHAVASWKPDWVAVHHAGDLNRDHSLAHEAARVACRPGSGVQHLLSYETLSSSEWGVQPFQPNLYVRLEDSDLEAKKNAFALYQTEVRPFPHPRSSEAIEHLAAVRGAESGFPWAEAFSSVWHRV